MYQLILQKLSGLDLKLGSCHHGSRKLSLLRLYVGTDSNRRPYKLVLQWRNGARYTDGGKRSGWSLWVRLQAAPHYTPNMTRKWFGVNAGPYC